MPHTKVYIHFVWTTKNRFPFLDTYDLRRNLWNHIKDNAKAKGIFIDNINGYKEHCHCLISLGIDQSMSKVMQLLKGESAYWMNKTQLLKYPTLSTYDSKVLSAVVNSLRPGASLIFALFLPRSPGATEKSQNPSYEARVDPRLGRLCGLVSSRFASSLQEE